MSGAQQNEVMLLLGEIKGQNEGIISRLDKIDKVVFTGNGKEPLTVRVDRLEERELEHAEARKDHRSTWSMVVATLAFLLSALFSWLNYGKHS